MGPAGEGPGEPIDWRRGRAGRAGRKRGGRGVFSWGPSMSVVTYRAILLGRLLEIAESLTAQELTTLCHAAERLIERRVVRLAAGSSPEVAPDPVLQLRFGGQGLESHHL